MSNIADNKYTNQENTQAAQMLQSKACCHLEDEQEWSWTREKQLERKTDYEKKNGLRKENGIMKSLRKGEGE